MGMLVFGADGGGTKTLGLVSDQDGNIVARRTAGASNPNVIGLDQAAKNLHELIARCCEDAECSPGDLRSLVLGLAGAGREENRRQLHERLVALAGRELPIVIETDARVGLEGAFNSKPGVLIIAGTGSVVIGKKSSGDVVMVGGWGRLLGDEGSGYWLGREALKSLALRYDGRGGSKLLTEMIGSEFGLTSRERVLGALYHEAFEISRIAPIVLAAAERDDAAALDILQRGAAALAEQARSVAERLNISGTTNLAFSGGLIDHETMYAGILRSNLAERIPNAHVQAPQYNPAHGAIVMALQFPNRTV